MAQEKTYHLPFISVCICTYGRPAKALQACLGSLGMQTYPANKYEVLVLDANIHSLEKQVHICDFEMTVNWINFGRRLTMPLARRKAMDYAHGEYIAFIDDDCLASDEWIEALVEGLRLNPRAGAIQGKVLPYRKHTLLERFADFDASQMEPIRQNGTIVNVCTCNCIIRPEAVNDFHLYLDSYSILESHGLYFSMEDYLLSQAIIKAGYPLAYCDNAIVYHWHPSKLNKKLRQFYVYGRGALAYCFVTGTANNDMPGYKLPNKLNVICMFYLWVMAIWRIAKKYPAAFCHNSPMYQRVTYPLLCWLIQGAYYLGFWKAHRDIDNVNILN